MSRDDRHRWDQKWQSLAGEEFSVHPLLAKNHHLLPGEGRALDLACGFGQNAIWLAQNGYSTLGLDLSPVALTRARARAIQSGVCARTLFVQVDLETTWPLPDQAFDLVCVFRFLNRRLFPAIRASLQPGGLVVYSTRHTGALAHHPSATHEFLLARGELEQVFSDWQILHAAEGEVDAELIARKG